MKSFAARAFGISLILLLYASTADAHSILNRETKNAGDYQVVMEATADVPDPYERFAITYTYLLLNKDGSQYVSFDSAKVISAKKKRRTDRKGRTSGPEERASRNRTRRCHAQRW